MFQLQIPRDHSWQIDEQLSLHHITYLRGTFLQRLLPWERLIKVLIERQASVKGKGLLAKRKRLIYYSTVQDKVLRVSGLHVLGLQL